MSYIPEGFKKRVFSVYEFSSIVKEVLSSELFKDVSIVGEVSKVSVKNGNAYIDLIDVDDFGKTKAQIKVIVFRNSSSKMIETLSPGERVIFKGGLNYYLPGGLLSFVAYSAYKDGQGDYLAKLEKLKAKLNEEGLFSQERKRKLPLNIKKVAIVTSKSGAAYHDILDTLKRKVPVSTVLFDCTVQGESAPKSMIRALKKAYESDCDIIVFGRGGGSSSDLACYNDEELVRYLAKSPKVVVSGIGHEIDTSLCDLVADIHQITPTAAANFILEDYQDVLMRLDDKLSELNKEYRKILSLYKTKLQVYIEKLKSFSVEEKIKLQKDRLQQMAANFNAKYKLFIQGKLNELQIKEVKLKSAYLNLLSAKRNQLEKIKGEIEKYNYSSYLKNGLALVKIGGKNLETVKQVKIDSQLEIGLADGIVLAKVTEVKGD